MIDLTTDNQDNSTFITSVELNDDLKTYSITYADGHTEEKVFDSVHNFNATLYRMEQQYYQYRDSFNEQLNKWFIDSIKKSLIDIVLTITGIIMTMKFVPGTLLKILIIVLVILVSLGYLLFKVRDLITIGYSTDYLESLGRFIAVQEKLKIPVTDPNTGKEEDWYLANLSDINIGTKVELYEQFAEVIEPEMREEQGRRFTKVLKGE